MTNQVFFANGNSGETRNIEKISPSDSQAIKEGEVWFLDSVGAF